MWGTPNLRKGMLMVMWVCILCNSTHIRQIKQERGIPYNCPCPNSLFNCFFHFGLYNVALTSMYKLPPKNMGIQGLIVQRQNFDNARKATFLSQVPQLAMYQFWKFCFSKTKGCYQFLVPSCCIDCHPIHRKEEITPYSGNGSYFCSIHIMVNLSQKSYPFSTLVTCFTSSAHSKIPIL